MAEKQSTRTFGPAGPTDEELEKTRPQPLVVWAARCSAYFLALGGIMLLTYVYYGFGTDPLSFPPGFRISPAQAGVNFVWGLAGTLIGFFAPRFATPYILAFAAFYTLVAGLGTFAGSALGMEWGAAAKVFYWLVVAAAWAIGIRVLLKKGRPG